MGRLLIATRDSQAACATLGANLTLTKLVLFASSAGIAGVGGALWGGVETEVNSNNFLFQLSLSLVLLVYIWGISSPSGALLAGLSLSAAFPQLAPHLPARWSQIGLILTGLGAMSVARYPNGTVGRISDAWQRIRATFGEAAAGSASPGAGSAWPSGDVYPVPVGAARNGEVRDLVPAADR